VREILSAARGTLNFTSLASGRTFEAHAVPNRSELGVRPVATGGIVPELTRTQREFRAAMANLVRALNVVTTDGPRGRAGMTVSAACSVTDARSHGPSAKR
jgi:hypothetical protein